MKRNSKWTGGYPTQEELLDINLRAIVSDCRGLVYGTLAPRSWADISSTWLDDEEPRNTQMHRSVEVRQKMSQSRHIAHAASILIANGMSKKDAQIKARELLKTTTSSQSMLCGKLGDRKND